MSAGQISLLKFDNSMNAPSIKCSPANVVEPFLSITCETNQRRAAIPYGALGPLAETRRFNAYALQRDSRQAEGGRKSGIYDIRAESSAMYVCRVLQQKRKNGANDRPQLRRTNASHVIPTPSLLFKVSRPRFVRATPNIGAEASRQF
jgi:hypothetical protein